MDEKDDITQSSVASGKKPEFLFYEDDVPDDPKKLWNEKKGIYKNVLLICLSFLLNFTAFAGISNLQSSLNDEENLGVVSLAVIYASLIISALFIPTYVIKHLGCKWTMFCAILGYTTYSVGNFYPHWGTLIPTSIAVGLSGAPLWSAKCAYLTTAAKRYARLVGESTDTVVNRFFGIFFLLFQTNQIIGNLISSFILSSADSINLEFPSNLTAEREDEIRSVCGANDCPYNDIAGNSSDDTPETTIYILMGTYTACGLLAAANMALFVDNITIRLTETRNTKELLAATFVQMKKKRQILLILITMYSGFEQAFLTGDFTKSFVTCPIAVNWVGFILICFGACDAVFSFLFGRVEKYTGRPPLFGLASVINLALIITFLTWAPLPSSPAPFFVIPALWGVADAVWQTQLNALYGVLFFNCQEEAFANYRLWESLGFVIAFAYQGFVCVYVKLYVLLSVLVVGMALYGVVEIMEKRRSASTNDNTGEHRNGKVEAISTETYENLQLHHERSPYANSNSKLHT